MFRSLSVGALCALLAAFLMAAVRKWAGFQPNRVVAPRQANSSHITVPSVSVDGASARGTISCRLIHAGDTLYGGVLKFLTDATDLMRFRAQRSSI